MNQLDLTRRIFFRPDALRLGGARASCSTRACSPPNLPASAQARPGLGFRTLSRAKRVIYLFQSGGPAQMDLFDYKPQLARPVAARNSRIGLSGRAQRRPMTRGQDVVCRAPSDVQVRAARQVRAPGSASCCRTPAGSPTTSASSSSMHTEAINHDPAITFFQTGAQLAGPAEHGLVAHLRPGQRERATCRRSSC